VAVAGGNVVKVLDVGAQYGEVRADCVELPLAQSVEVTGWSRDGQVGGREGGAHCCASCCHAPAAPAWGRAGSGHLRHSALLTAAPLCAPGPRGRPQVLTVSTAAGAVYSYLAALPVLYDTCGSQLLHLTSLAEMSLMDAPSRTLLHSIQTEAEPHVCGLGPRHAAVGINNQVGAMPGGSLPTCLPGCGCPGWPAVPACTQVRRLPQGRCAGCAGC
jgi:WD repeat-containing protein 19